MAKRELPVEKKIIKKFEGYPALTQFLLELVKAGYDITEDILDKKEMTLRRAFESFALVNNDEIVVDYYADGKYRTGIVANFSGKSVRLQSDAYTMNITGNEWDDHSFHVKFSPRGNIKTMYLNFYIHNKIGGFTLLECIMATENVPFIEFVAEEYTKKLEDDSLVLEKRRKIKFSLKPGYTLDESKEERGCEEEACTISKEELEEWSTQLLLDYQTSDAKLMINIIDFIKRVKDYIEKYGVVALYYYTKVDFSSLLVRCMEDLAKYTDEVVESTSYDLGLSSSESVKHILEYAQKK